MKTALILKKMAAIVAIVGAGLLAAPLEQAQAQTGIPQVTEFCIVSNAASDYGLRHGWIWCPPLLDTSGSPLKWIYGTIPHRYYFDSSGSDDGSRYGYVSFLPRTTDGNNTPIYDDEWILVTFYLDLSGDRASISAWVEDSDGNEYTIDAWISYYGWRD